MEENRKQSVRIQKSVLNAGEKKLLVWLASRMPSWVTSDMLTYTGMVGAFIIAVGYALSGLNINWLWLASFGFVVNWFGDSLDGTIARVRNTQRPVYGFFLDHNVDVVNEVLMFAGAGLSPLMRFDVALGVLVAYLMLSVYVYINAHLKNEFRLSYAGLGPTEFRIIVIIVNTLYIFIPALRNLSFSVCSVSFSVLDIIAMVITVLYGVLNRRSDGDRLEKIRKKFVFMNINLND